MTPNTAKWLRLIFVVVVVLLLDQVSKRCIIANLPYQESVQPIPALYPFFQFTYTENPGAAFGFLPQGGVMFLVIALVVSVGMAIFYPRVPPKAIVTQIALGMVLAGALGNAIDRIDHGAVIDFIHYQIPGVISNVSNLADHGIVIGVIILFIQSWKSDAQQQPDAERKLDAQHQATAPKAGDEPPPTSV